MDNYQTVLLVTGALAKLVIVSMVLERGLSVIFEHEWFVRATTKEVKDPLDENKKIRENRIPSESIAFDTGLLLCLLSLQF